MMSSATWALIAAAFYVPIAFVSGMVISLMYGWASDTPPPPDDDRMA